MTAHTKPRIVTMCGATRPGSTSERAMRWMIAAIGDTADVACFTGDMLTFPLYDPTNAEHGDSRVDDFIEAIRRCDALVIASPVYHGGPAGLLKNAIDHIQPLMTDSRPYLTGRAVCCIAAGGGLPGAVATLSALRDVVHSLRGWPTPMQIPISSSGNPFDDDNTCSDAKLEKTMRAAVADLQTFVDAMRRPAGAEQAAA